MLVRNTILAILAIALVMYATGYNPFEERAAYRPHILVN